jgi:RNA methyltransferase, TrmH family
MITSLQNDKVKLVYGLQNRPRTRRKERKFVLEGARLIADALSQKRRPLFALYEAQTADYNLIAQLQALDVPLIDVSDEIMLHVADTQTPQGMIAVFPWPNLTVPRKPKRILVMDNMRDPGNMGTILRTAAAAGVELVILSPGCTDPFNPKVARSGMGAHWRVPLAEAKWHEIETFCEDLIIYAAVGTGDTRYDQADWMQPHALIIGSEAHGVGSHGLALAHHQVFIPMVAQTESLNAAMAAGILLFEASRQNLTDTP